jgi:hypothetical protein
MKKRTKDFEEEISKMFLDQVNVKMSDEELALHIIQRFNIDRDTLETMPAFDKHIKQLFSEVKDK